MTLQILLICLKLNWILRWLTAFKSDILEGQELREIELQKKLKKDITSSLKSPGNNIQFEFNEEVTVQQNETNEVASDS